MPYRKFAFVVGERYHLFNRGNNFEDVFFNQEDYVLFLRLLRKYLVSRGTIELEAYCLMPNHYHLLICLVKKGLSSALQAMGLAFTKTLNRKYERVGTLFQGRFGAVRVERQEHLMLLMAYIHHNPVEAGLVRKAEDWKYSSYRDLVGLRRGTLVVKGSVLPETQTSLAEGIPPAKRALIEGLVLE